MYVIYFNVKAETLSNDFCNWILYKYGAIYRYNSI